MPKKRVRSLRCPTCRGIVLRKDPEFPFCSERCRLIDLGKWASGGYVISSPVHDPEILGDLQLHQNQQAAKSDGPHKEDDERHRR